MADEGTGGNIEQQFVRDTPDRDRDLSASASAQPKVDRSHAGAENGARPKGTGLSVTVFSGGEVY